MQRNLKVVRAILEYLEERTVDAGGARKPLVDDLPDDAPIHPLTDGGLDYHAGLCADEGLIVDRSSGFVSLSWKGHDWLEKRRRLTGGQPASPPVETPAGGPDDGLPTGPQPSGDGSE